METRNGHAVNPYVFIVGCPRSGTTLLKRMVNAHPQIAIVRESPWIVQWFEERKGVTPDGQVTPELISHLLENPKFTRLHVGKEQLQALLAAGQPISYASFITSIFDLYGEAQGKAMVGNKTPWYVRRLPTLHDLWPKARFVHLIRDGRNVCLSMANWPTTHRNHPAGFRTWNDDPVSTAALWWEVNVRSGRQAGNWLGPELYYEIRYESLVANPAQECAALCAFLGLPFNDGMLRFFEGRTRQDPALESKERWLPVTAGLRDWNSQMSPEDVERFETAAGKLLDELGYPRVFPHPNPESLGKAARVGNLLAQDPNWTGAVRDAQARRADDASGIRDSRAAVSVLEARSKTGLEG